MFVKIKVLRAIFRFSHFKLDITDAKHNKQSFRHKPLQKLWKALKSVTLFVKTCSRHITDVLLTVRAYIFCE